MRHSLATRWHECAEFHTLDMSRFGSIRLTKSRRLNDIETQLPEQLVCLAIAEAPKIEPEAHCHSPFSYEHS